MPRFEPFPGLRYSLPHVGSLDAVACPPYDVISDDERRTLLRRSPYNVVRIELPVDEGDGVDPYEGAAALLDAWRDGGVLAREQAPAFYGHRMRWTDDSGVARQSIGVIGALVLEAPGQGILPHEETTPKAKSDRLQLLRALRANTSPIWALTPATGLAALCGAPDHPVEHVTTADGVTHECWPITDPGAVAAIGDHVAGAPVLVADGHHRYETALAHQRAQEGPGDHDAVMALVGEPAAAQLAVQAIHRLVDNVDSDELVTALSGAFTMQRVGPPDAGILSQMRDAGAVAVHTRTGTWLGVPTAATTAQATHDLDSSRLDVALRQLPAASVRFQHGWDLATGAVDRGEAAAAVLLRPATVAQIAEISRGGVRMPPKTTFFWPKPRTGMVLRELIGDASA